MDAWMAEKKNPDDEKTFRIADTPLEVKLSIARDTPPSIHIRIGGPKHDEHKDPRYVRAITHLLDDLKYFIQTSKGFPQQGRLATDPYIKDHVPLFVRYPGDPPPHYKLSFFDTAIREPMAKSKRTARNKKDSDTLFNILLEKIP